MAGLKPNEFGSITPTGTTEVYTQTDGVNGKFTLGDVKTYIDANTTSEWTEVIVDISPTGTTYSDGRPFVANGILGVGFTPIEILPQPGVNKYYVYKEIIIEYTYGTIQYSLSEPLILGEFSIFPGLIQGVVNRVAIMQSSSFFHTFLYAGEYYGMAEPKILNNAFNLSTFDYNNPTLGDGSLKLKIKYRIDTFG